MNCSECGVQEPLCEVAIRGWPHLVSPGQFVKVITCWECGHKRATHERLTFRDVTLDDAEILHQWRNDPISRASSWHQEPIFFDHHQRWLTDILRKEGGLSATHFWIAEIGGVPVGSIRVMPTTPPEVSTIVAPQFRGAGLAAAILQLAPIPVGAIEQTKGENPGITKALTAAGWRVKSIAYEKI